MERATACLQIAMLMKEADAKTTTVTLRGVSREFYDMVPFAVEVELPSTGQWMKELQVEGMSVEVLTSEPPARVISFPPRRPKLTVVK